MKRSGVWAILESETRHMGNCVYLCAHETFLLKRSPESPPHTRYLTELIPLSLQLISELDARARAEALKSTKVAYQWRRRLGKFLSLVWQGAHLLQSRYGASPNRELSRLQSKIKSFWNHSAGGMPEDW